MAETTSGIIAGSNPLIYNSDSPYTIFFFQVVVILTFSQIIYIPLARFKQPRVLAEVLTGIVLSHTALGRFPNFTTELFSTSSRQGLTLVANIGICLLMFIVGCEVDVKFIKKHIITALSVGLLNMAVPFGLGCACSVGLWNDYRLHVEGLPDIKFTTFMVFIATAMCITAFPVLVRILTELRLVKDRVGTVVLAAGITNDLLGWILLALSITLANASQSIVTLYIVLVAIGWCLFVCYPLRIILNLILKKFLKEFDDPNSPSRLAMLIILLMMFGSAFFTDIIGVHPIFGAFLIGTIVPRENNYVINLTSRIEDLVNIIFVPIYFGVAGLDVDLGLLNKGLDWGWSFGLIGVALIGKILGGFVAAKLRGLYWRESFTVGVLMSCKGIVEIVVLQVGLNAYIISRKTYSMFIFMALITTFLTTPLTIYSYPDSYREKVQLWLSEEEKKKAKSKSKSIESNNNENQNNNDNNENNENENKNNDNNESNNENNEVSFTISDIQNFKIDKLIIPIDNVESVSNGLLLLDLFLENLKVPIHAINLKTLTERTADLLHASMIDGLATSHDYKSLNSVISIFRIFCHFNKIPFTSQILYSLPDSYIQTLLENSTFTENNLLILPICKHQFSIEFLSSFIYESNKISNEYKSRKSIFISGNEESENLDSKTYDQNKIIKSVDSTPILDNKSSFSDNTILSPSTLLISTVTLYITNPELKENDKLGMKLFDLLIRRKDLISANIILCNIESESKTYDLISSWILSNDDIFNNVYLSLESTNDSNLKNSIINNPDNKSFDRLVIISSEENNLGLISKLVDSNEKVFVLV